MSGDDPRLQEYFDALERADRERAPRYERVRDAALERTAPRPGPRFALAFAAVAIAALVWWLPGGRTPDLLCVDDVQTLGSWRTPSDALLEFPSLSSWKDTPRFEPGGYLEPPPEPQRSERFREWRIHA